MFKIIVVLISLLMISKPAFCADEVLNPFVFVNGKSVDLRKVDPNNNTLKITLHTEIEHEAHRLAENGEIEEALKRYQDALHPLLYVSESDQSMARWGILQMHEWQGKFDLALEELQWFLKARPDKDHYINKRMELEAFIKMRETKSNRPIYEFIDYLKKKYDKYLPPKGWNSSVDNVISTIIQLYDYMGDAEGGIAFIERILTDKYLQKPSKVRDEYLAMIKAFEADKKAGTTGGPKRIILQSDNMPW